MKHLRQSLALALTLAVVGVFGLAFAQPTAAGTDITNTASATFTDAGGNTQSADSNTVTTTVQAVYALTVSPSDTTTPTSGDGTLSGADTDFTLTPAYDNSVTEGTQDVEFFYTVTNGTNDDNVIALSTVQGANGTDDEFDFTNVEILRTDSAGIPLATQPLDLNNIDFPQGESFFFIIRADVPTGLTTGDTAKIDLLATSSQAEGAGQTGPNVSFDNNNIGQATILDATIGLAKNLASVTGPDGSGAYTIVLDFYLDNTGAVDVDNLSLVDNLDTTFGAGNYSVSAQPSFFDDPGTITLATNYDGSGQPDLFVPGSSSLVVGDTAQVQITVVVNGPTTPTTENIATVTGTSPTGTTTTNDSTDGTTPDPNTNVPTPIVLENPVVSVSKDATIISTDNGAAPFTVEFDIYIENQGDVDLSNLSATEDLDTAFGSGNFTITSAPTISTPPTSGGVTLNAGFNGGTDTELIGTGSSLTAGEIVVITLAVEVATAGDYTNSVVASGDSPGGTPTTDTSNPGPTPSDPPGDDDTPTSVNLSGLTLTKSASTTSDTTGGNVEPGDTITYTIRVENTGTSDLTNVVVSDAAPAPTTYNAGTATSADVTGTTTVVIDDTGTPITWTIATLAGGAVVDLTFQVTVP